MPATGLDIFDKAVQKSNEWLNELGQHDGIGPEHQRAYDALRSVLWTVLDLLQRHVPEGEMAHVRRMMPKPLESYMAQARH